MTQCWIENVDDDAPCSCGDCAWTGPASDLDMISDIQERLTPNDPVPAGQCPECGDLAYLDEDDAQPDDTHRAALQAIANAAPEVDPGEGEWHSIADAYLCGVTQGQYVAAVTARAALSGQAPAPIPAAPDYRALLVALLDAMETPRSRKGAAAWDAARAAVAAANKPKE